MWSRHSRPHTLIYRSEAARRQMGRHQSLVIAGRPTTTTIGSKLTPSGGSCGDLSLQSHIISNDKRIEPNLRAFTRVDKQTGDSARSYSPITTRFPGNKYGLVKSRANNSSPRMRELDRWHRNYGAFTEFRVALIKQ